MCAPQSLDSFPFLCHTVCTILTHPYTVSKAFRCKYGWSSFCSIKSVERSLMLHTCLPVKTLHPIVRSLPTLSVYVVGGFSTGACANASNDSTSRLEYFSGLNIVVIYIHAFNTPGYGRRIFPQSSWHFQSCHYSLKNAGVIGSSRLGFGLRLQMHP